MTRTESQSILDAVRRLPALGTQRILFVGLTDPDSLRDLLGAGLDVQAIAVSEIVATAAEARTPGRVRYQPGDSFPHPDGSFDLVILASGTTAGTTRSQRATRFREARRISGRRILLCLPLPCCRTTWEREALDAGLRRDSLAVYLAPIDAGAATSGYLHLLWCPASAEPLDDPLARTGESALEELALYRVAGGWIRQQDAVIDLDCHTGYGTALLRDATPCRTIQGLGKEASQVRAGSQAYGVDLESSPTLDLSAVASNSTDVIVATGHSLGEASRRDACVRILKPGGRLLVRTPGTGLPQVHEWLQSPLLADQSMQADTNCIQVHDGAPTAEQAGHWLVSAIKDPIGGESVPYQETVFAAPRTPTPAVEFSGHYVNPWLVHSMVLGGIRIRSTRLLKELARRVLASYPPDSADAGGALCVLAYQDDVDPGALDRYLELDSDNPHVQRWQVSLLFVQGILYRRAGAFDLAEQSFLRCARSDFMRFGGHLATKATEAALEAGWLALVRNDPEAARSAWQMGVDAAARALEVPIDAWLIQPDYPSRFEMGDGLRELAMAIDNAAGCANGLHELAGWRGSDQGPRYDIHHRFQSGYTELYRDLQQTKHELATQRNRRSLDPLSWLLMGNLPAPEPIPFLHPTVPGRVSVIIPVYNGEAFIERTVRSVWDQTLPAKQIELVVVDDGSTDGSLEVLERLRDQSPISMQVITHPNRENRGVCATRNRCFQHAAGEYIALLDADDLFLPRRLEATTHYLDHHPDCQALCALGHNVDMTGNRIVGYNGTEEAGNYRDVPPGLEPPFTFEQLWEAYPVANSTITIRRDALGETGGYPERMAHQAEDWLLMLKLSLESPIAVLDEHLIHYTHHPGSYTTLYHTNQFDHGCRVEVFHLLTYWMLQHPQLRNRGIQFYRKHYPMIMAGSNTPNLQDLPGILNRAARNGIRMGPVQSARMLWNTLRQAGRKGT